MICSTCNKTLKGPYDGLQDDYLPHHQSYRSFLRSVDQGCYICNRLWAQFHVEQRPFIITLAETESDHSSKTTKCSADTDSSDCIQTNVTKASLYKPYRSDYLRDADDAVYLSMSLLYIGSIAPDPRNPIKRRFVHLSLDPTEDTKTSLGSSRLSEHTRSPETLGLAQRWVSQCFSNHDACNEGREHLGWYPTRLIDCGSLETPDCDCRLIESNSSSLDGPYMTLSHCWGSTDCLKLTTSNYNELKANIPFTLLPQLYQDAVYVTRQLSIRYLWIDSLCIIQQGDDREDWYREVKTMSQVYSNTFCNISASDAPDGYHTMFSTRNPDVLYPEAIQLEVDSRLCSFTIVDESYWINEVHRAPINIRGWVLQERLLSPRILHFSNNEILWECMEKEAAEIYPDGLPNSGQASKQFKRLVAELRIFADRNDKFEIYNIWRGLIGYYSDCKLTVPTDKLPALSAIAKVTGHLLQDDYIAGMWRNNLETELLWTVNGSGWGDTPPPDSPDDFPTWSWAASSTVIAAGHLGNPANLLFKVKDVEMEYYVEGDTSMVKSGRLQLWGKLKQTIPGAPCCFPNKKGYIRAWNVHGQDEDIIGTGTPKPNGRSVFRLDHPKGYDEGRYNGKVLYYMLGKQRTAITRDVCYPVVESLLLELVDAEQGIYRRLGMAVEWDAERRHEVLEQSAEDLECPCQEYVDGLHVFTVI